jgi:hypothetical protein
MAKSSIAHTKPAAPRIIKKGTCPLIAPSSKGQLSYHIGYSDQDKTLHFRVTSNTGGGYFSREWVSLDAILEHIQAQPAGQPFKSLVLRKAYVSTGANNCGFLAAVLRAEGLLQPVPKSPFSHTHGDVAQFQQSMEPLIKAKTDLEDEVAIEEAAKAKLREQKAETMRKILAEKKKAQPISTALEPTPSPAPAKPVKKPPRKTTAKSA